MSFERTYEIAADGKSITCKLCLKTSYHLVDVRERYCGFCHEFHDERALRKAMVKQGHMKEI